ATATFTIRRRRRLCPSPGRSSKPTSWTMLNCRGTSTCSTSTSRTSTSQRPGGEYGCSPKGFGRMGRGLRRTWTGNGPNRSRSLGGRLTVGSPQLPSAEAKMKASESFNVVDEASEGQVESEDRHRFSRQLAASAVQMRHLSLQFMEAEGAE